MKNTLLVFAFLFMAGVLFADNEGTKNTTDAANSAKMVTISGTVLDLNNGEALTGVEVYIQGTDKKTYTDFDGNFTFENLTPGEYDIVASYISYKRSLIEDFTIDDNKQLEIKLQED